MTTTEKVAQALIAQGVDYTAAEDKAFCNDQAAAMNAARGGLEATVKALALVLGTDPAHAAEAILTAFTDTQEV